jgi:adenylate cyclase
MSCEELQTLLNQADTLIIAGKYDEAERPANQVLTELDNPDFVPSGKDHDRVLLRAKATITLADIARLRGNHGQSLTLAQAAVALAEEYNLTAITPRAWTICGNVNISLGNYDTALQYFNKAIEVHEQLGEKSAAAAVTGNTGIVYKNLTNYDKALQYFTKALAVHEELGEKSRAANIAANTGIVYYTLGNYDNALHYLTNALAVLEELGEKRLAAGVTGNIGIVYKNLGNYDKALQYFNKVLAVHEELGSKSLAANVIGNIGNVYRHLGNYDKALEYYTKALAVQEELGQKSEAAIATGNIGNVYLNLGNYDKALQYYTKALGVHEALGQKSGVGIVTGNIGSVYRYFGDYDKALEFYTKALAAHEELGEKSRTAAITGDIGALYADKNNEFYNAGKAEEILLNAIALSTGIGAKAPLVEWHKTLADLYENEGRLADAFLQFKKYHDIEKEVLSEEATKQALMMENRRKVEESERDRQVKLARFQEQEKILHNILPSQIANRMVAGEKTIADTHQNVSVFFSDIVDFTTLSQQVSAVELVGQLNGIFSQFDRLARKHGLEKIKTIGDAYMAVCGAPIQVDNHAERTALFALDVVELMNNYQTNTGDKVMIRIGLHTGSVVAGIIGENKFAYDMWGDAVNTASRMESHGEAGKIHVSEEFKHAVETLHATSLQFIRRGEMDIKGKGKMKTYFLEKESHQL